MKSLLEALARAIPDCKINQLEAAVSDVLGARLVHFQYADETSSRPIQADAQAEEVLSHPVEMRVHFHPAQRQLAATFPDPQNEPAVQESTAYAARPELARFIRELDILESRSPNAFVWIKFLVQERIPQLGIPPREANEFLDAMLRQAIVGTKKVPNPNRPDFPSTGVVLNRSHPLVQEVLRNSRAPRRQPIEMPGGPLSDDLVRDRR